MFLASSICQSLQFVVCCWCWVVAGWFVYIFVFSRHFVTISFFIQLFIPLHRYIIYVYFFGWCFKPIQNRIPLMHFSTITLRTSACSYRKKGLCHLFYSHCSLHSLLPVYFLGFFFVFFYSVSILNHVVCEWCCIGSTQYWHHTTLWRAMRCGLSFISLNNTHVMKWHVSEKHICKPTTSRDHRVQLSVCKIVSFKIRTVFVFFKCCKCIVMIVIYYCYYYY